MPPVSILRQGIARIQTAGFVSGHDFSRAATGAKSNVAFRPCGMSLLNTSRRQSRFKHLSGRATRVGHPYCGAFTGAVGGAGAAVGFPGASVFRVSTKSTPGKSAESLFVDILIVSPSTVQSW